MSNLKSIVSFLALLAAYAAFGAIAGLVVKRIIESIDVEKVAGFLGNISIETVGVIWLLTVVITLLARVLARRC